MRADRLLSILMLLQSKGRMTASELARRLEVSERTIYRDIEALSMAGVPVYAERGPGGGCALLDGYRTNLTGLSEPEVFALFLSTMPGPLNDLGMDKEIRAAMLKLNAALPLSHRDGVEWVRKRVYLDGAEWFHNTGTVPFLAAIQEAIWQNRRLRMHYRRTDGVSIHRHIDPYGMVAKGNIWYFVGSFVAQSRPLGVAHIQPARKDIRVYRVSRVLDLEVTNEPSERSPDFDLQGYWAEWCANWEASLPSYSVTVRTNERDEILQRIEAGMLNCRCEVGAPAGTDGAATLTLVFPSHEAACGALLSLGTAVEVVDPPELRESLLDAAARIISHYAGV